MRGMGAAGTLLAIAAILASPALAQGPCANDKALGVSRTIEIDTSEGPQFGFQYKEASALLREGEVVLTFDDGPMRAYTRVILEALAAHCTKATFFMVGRMAVADPEMVQEVARQGHTVASHTWSHANLQQLSAQRAHAEIELGFSAVQHALGKPIAPFFRFPYLRDSASLTGYLRGRQIGAFSIDVDSKDYTTKDPGSVHHRIMAGLAGPRRGILLFHDIHASTARALPGLLADLKAKGYRVVHIQPKAGMSTLAEYDEIAAKERGRRHAAAAGRPLAKRSLVWPADGQMMVEPTPGPSGRRLSRGAQEEDWRDQLWRW